MVLQNRLFHKTMAGTTLAILVLTIIAMPLAQISVSPIELVPKASILLFLLAGGAFYYWRNEERLFNVFVVSFWLILFTNLYLLPMYMFARSPVPLRDDILARLDALLGVN